MTKVANRLWNFLKQEDGPTAVEYAVMLALIIVVCIAAINALGSYTNNNYNTMNTSMSNANASAS